MQSLVIDTNVLISAALSDKGNPAQLVKMVSEGKRQLSYNSRILSEYADVLSREKFNFSPEKQRELISKIVEIGVIVDPVSSDTPMLDEDDRIFYDTAKESGAILVTGNIKHYPTESFIMTPTDYMSLKEDDDKAISPSLDITPG